MTQKMFQAACAALWGPAYQSPGARELGIGLRSMVRYANGERDVPDALLMRLGIMLSQRRSLIDKLQAKIDATVRRAA